MYSEIQQSLHTSDVNVVYKENSLNQNEKYFNEIILEIFLYEFHTF